MAALEDAQVFLPDVWATHAAFQPDREAVVCGDERLTWGELDLGLNRVANALGAEGIGRGERVAVLMSDSIDTLLTLLGVVKCGASVVPLSGMLTAEQLAVLIADAGAGTLITSADLQPRIEPAKDGMTTIAADRFLLRGGAAAVWRDFDDLVAAAPDTPPKVRYRMTDEYNIIYSSGTTGLPKGIAQSHRARQHWSYSNAIELAFDGDSRALTTTPLYSNGTLLMVLPALFVGATLVIMPGFSPRGFLEAVAEQRISHTFMVPPQFIAVLADAAIGDFDLSSLTMMLSGGSPLRRDIKQAVLERMGPGLFEMYGFSEGCATMIRPQQHADKFGSVGTPVLGYEVRIVDEAGDTLPRGEVGEIAGYGGGQMLGYHNRPEATEEIICPDERGRQFLRSGDIGRLDADGFLYILDRKKDMIISGGFNIFPADIEGVIGEHPAVQDVTVIGIPDERWGETPLALVIPAADADAEPDDIKAWSNQRLAKHQRVKAVEFREEFPRNALGKVLKRMLRAPYWDDEAP
ncbi:MAG: AMP-binding protein [Alphaproteobacteria bacterium]|jgi:acyl-CoA synthetase (AMP-forming)/AMP-acid ligase II|nr:AMP-binding protein [Alphaproteobacteria bacterium]MDP6566321.1 AMP-binding protein [Alphaproteobacteria bacterium]MDP6812698.1 AMP-binding protein [Alphaproteobacteria bacterium]